VPTEILSSFPLSATAPGLTNTLVGGDSPNARYLLSQVQTALAPGAWSTYTPSVVATAGAFTTVSATGAYSKIGRQVSVRIVVTMTARGTATAAYVTLPFASTDNAVFVGYETTNGTPAIGIATSLYNGVQNMSIEPEEAFESGFVFVFSGTYESIS
jgi:hypothetical protein